MMHNRLNWIFFRFAGLDLVSRRSGLRAPNDLAASRKVRPYCYPERYLSGNNRLWVGVLGWLGVFGVVGTVSAAGYGFDVLLPPAAYAKQLKEAELTGAQGEWMRVRGVIEPGRGKANATRTVETDRAGLRALRARGVRAAVLLRWGPDLWSGGVRAGGGHRMPLDLREAYERGRRLGAAYGDLVDVWEVDNEPDIGFGPDNPEVYAGFLKAVYLGIKRGREEAPGALRATALNLRAEGSRWRERKSGGAVGVEAWGRARVVMAPLALPPGLYLERLWANGLASYTDGFNFHYYGYAEDFTGVYRQFEQATRDLSADAQSRTSNAQHSIFNFEASERERARGLHRTGLVTSSATLDSKRLPVFITEYGYGLLDAAARNTVEGRVRQWRWFADVGRQVGALRPEGPMAFLWTPYYEAELNEFGLMMKAPMEGDLAVAPEDLGAAGSEPWMRRMGKKVGADYASPALAQLWAQAEENPYRPRDWRVRTEPASPVVVDLIAGEGMAQAKVSGGYRLSGEEEGKRTGRAVVVLYNLGAKAVRGRMVIDEPNPVAAGGAAELIVLAPGERREVPVVLAIPGSVWTERSLRMRFVMEEAGAPAAVFRTGLLPSSAGMTLVPVETFGPAMDNREAVQRQAARVPAGEEPRLYAQGRWLVTDGVRVEEQDGVWRFHIDYLSEASFRPAAVELPLPAGFEFKPDTLLTFEYRRVGGAGESGGLDREGRPLAPSRLIPLAGRIGDGMTAYVRTLNGNLYGTTGRMRLADDWRYYAGRAQDFSMGFFGRAELPWRFADNRPASLFFFLRPATVPAVFEVRNARIVRVE